MGQARPGDRAGPAASAAATLEARHIPATPTVPGTSSQSSICLSGITDLGPFGPLGPYGPSGPYGANGPLHNQTNPIGNAATCGGLLTFILRGGTLQSFVQASVLPGQGS